MKKLDRQYELQDNTTAQEKTEKNTPQKEQFAEVESKPKENEETFIQNLEAPAIEAPLKEKDANAEEDPLTDDDEITLESSRVNADALSQVHSVAQSKMGGPFDDAISQVPTELISQIPSQAPTEQLAAEYKKLMDEYDTICTGNKQMEQQVENLKKEWKQN